MAQLTLYVPDELAARLRREAKRAKKSLSAFVVERLEGGSTTASDRRAALLELYGSASLPAQVEDAPIDEVEGL